MVLMVILGVSLRFVQEARADAAAEKLKAMINVTAAVVRGGKEEEVPLKQLVPGDVVLLAAGDDVPADCFSSKARPDHAKAYPAGRTSRATSSIAAIAWPDDTPGAPAPLISAARNRL